MEKFHWILIALWIIYYVLHSVFAAGYVKELFKNKLGKYFRYYRLAYSLFATITLILVLIFQYSFHSPLLLKSLLIKYFAIALLILPGIIIMAISIKKYFMLLSGIRSLFTPTPAAELKINGIHQYVRHPLYLGTLLFVTGLFFVFPTLSNLIAVALLTVYVLIGIIFEEKKLIKEFGESYKYYILNVPMLIPSFRKKGIKKKETKLSLKNKIPDG